MLKYLILFFMISTNIFAADSVKVESKFYTAPFKDEYREDTALYKLPFISGGADAVLLSKLNSYLVSDSILGDNIDSIISDYKQFGAGITGCDYNILYNKYGVLSISVYVETMGAYPDRFYTDVNLNLNTGYRILARDIIDAGALKKLAEKLDKIVQKRIKDKVMQEDMGEEDALQFFEGKHFTEENLGHFAFTDKGIMFYYDYGLPHALQALSPDEDMLLEWSELTYFVKEKSLLDKIMHK
ncbi:MAG: hypothetical protein JST55_01470 [Bacteroidetes bacterium]|nr:hypothetical protein [Bacteroidota bacterium]